MEEQEEKTESIEKTAPVEKKNRKGLLIALSVGIGVAAVIIAGLIVFSYKQHQDMQQIVEQLEFEKESIQDEYEDLAIQFDGYQQLDIQNDSLQDKLAQEQQRVRDLLEELKITKATDARRINELKKELATVRALMVQYVHQIDSLNQINQRLTEENDEFRRQNKAIIQTNTELTEQKTQLERVVTRAARLEIEDFSVLCLKKNDRKTTIFNQIQKIQFTYSISKNVTSETGEKTVYLVLRRPDGEVMQKNARHTFTFEEQNIPYSLRQSVEYNGEQTLQNIYWVVEEILQKGTYTAEFFIDGSLCGSFTFMLGK